MSDATETPPPQEQPMEIHKPKPVHNWRELLTEIGVVVIADLPLHAGLEGDAPGEGGIVGDDFRGQDFARRRDFIVPVQPLHRLFSR